jgi:hypothetical protein
VVQAMTDKLNDLFAPERLRKSWQKTKSQAARLVNGERQGESLLDFFEHLRNLIQTKFSGDDADALDLLVEELHTLLMPMFPEVGKRTPPAENQAEIISAIHDVLNRIEDLVDAFEIAGRSRAL